MPPKNGKFDVVETWKRKDCFPHNVCRGRVYKVTSYLWTSAASSSTLYAFRKDSRAWSHIKVDASGSEIQLTEPAGKGCAEMTFETVFCERKVTDAERQ